MKSLWNDKDAAKFGEDAVGMRVYTSRLLGREPTLVLHGGGNTSVKTHVQNIYGDSDDIIYVKGSGWDLATIESAGFAPVRLAQLKRMAELERLGDSEMVRLQRTAMIDPAAPNPSVEAILHAIIPYRYVDHTHADAVVTITNTDTGEQRIRDIYGARVMIVPYVMPGFVLARTVYEMTRDIDWQTLDGLILLHHGVFTFANDARTSYESMIRLVTAAEEYLEVQGSIDPGDVGSDKDVASLAHHTNATAPRQETSDRDTADPSNDDRTPRPALELAALRKAVCNERGGATVAVLDTRAEALRFAGRSDMPSIATRGPLTPDHVLRTKRLPLIVDGDAESAVSSYAKQYLDYFERHTGGHLTCLDAAPCWAVWPQRGIVSFGRSIQEAHIVSDIKDHTIAAIETAERLGGWQALPEKDIFDIEYWELEQAKLRRVGSPPSLQGKVAIVTGAASGIGHACVETLRERGAVVGALDIRANISAAFDDEGVLNLTCDVTDETEIASSIEKVVRRFGGIDLVVSNAGIFPPSQNIAHMSADMWQQSLAVNLTGHEYLLKNCIPYLELGVDPAVVVVGSKNVPAPGPGASAYSVAKAGLTQLARVAALELAPQGIRVNVVHPNNVFDTAIWTPKVLAERAKHYGMSVDEYKRSNLLGVSVTSQDVAALICAMVGPLFAKTTGAQIPIDGGNDRVI